MPNAKNQTIFCYCRRAEAHGVEYCEKNQGIDEMPKSQIEKRKRNMESIYRISRRKKRNVEICFLVREENENFCKK